MKMLKDKISGEPGKKQPPDIKYKNSGKKNNKGGENRPSDKP